MIDEECGQDCGVLQTVFLKVGSWDQVLFSLFINGSREINVSVHNSVPLGFTAIEKRKIP